MEALADRLDAFLSIWYCVLGAIAWAYGAWWATAFCTAFAMYDWHSYWRRRRA